MSAGESRRGPPPGGGSAYWIAGWLLFGLAVTVGWSGVGAWIGQGWAWTLSVLLLLCAGWCALQLWSPRDRSSADVQSWRQARPHAPGRLVDQVLAQASHEVRQPVQALELMVEELRINPAAAEVRPQVDAIAKVVDSLSSSLKAVLDLTRLREGSVTPRIGLFSLSDLMGRIEADFSMAAKGKGLRFHVDTSADVHVKSDPALLYLIVSNFVSNAIRYTSTGSVSVRVESGSAVASISVVDTGRGIAPQYRELIFKDFVRLPAGESEPQHGFGVGLAIASRAARLMDLHIDLQSAPDAGSSFVIRVPCAPRRAPAPDRKPAASPSASRTLVGVKVLVLDNDPLVLEGLERLLQAWGGTVHCARSLEDAYRVLSAPQAQALNFILADYHLANGTLNGLDAIKLLRRRCGRAIAAGVLTGDLSVVVPEGPALVGVKVLHKPIRPTMLRAMLESMTRTQVEERVHRAGRKPVGGSPRALPV